MKFKSERLLFRDFIKDDYDLFSSIFSNEEVMRYAYMDQINDISEMTEYFNQVINNVTVTQNKSSYEFAVFLKDEQNFIGFADILIDYHCSRVKHGEIGYFLLPQYWGQGYATEIAEVHTDFCFTEIKTHKVVASCNANNPQSERIMKKIGMTKEGEFRKERFKNGNWDNDIRYGILVEEWKDKSQCF
ncbi:UNVERIFIED_CONTAM: ribosomal-protein-alanine N-acetyltransferase [Acetivibrio alkalicellulosi]